MSSSAEPDFNIAKSGCEPEDVADVASDATEEEGIEPVDGLDPTSADEVEDEARMTGGATMGQLLVAIKRSIVIIHTHC
jgi:hypothetical protein